MTPFKAIPLHGDAPLPLPSPLLAALFEGYLLYHSQAIIRRIFEDAQHCFKSSSFKGYFYIRKQKKVGREQVRRTGGLGMKGTERFAKD
jgi:hypothetical protein